MNLRTLTLGILLLQPAMLWAQTNLPPVRVALVSTCGGDSFANELALAGAKLSKAGDIALVERAHIQRVLEEQNQWRCGLSDAQQALAAGRLLGVELFAAVEILSPTNPAPGIVIFDAGTGTRLWDGLLPEGNLEQTAAGIAGAVRGAVAKRNRTDESGRTVCVLSVRNTGLPREMDASCEAVGRVLERQLIESASLAVLERDRLEQINAERNLPGPSATNGLLASLTLIEIEISRAQTNVGLTSTVFLTDSAGRVLTRIEASVPEHSPGHLVQPLLRKLLKALDATPLSNPPDRNREAQRFLNESIFLWNDGNRIGAWRAAEAAGALEPEQVKNLNQLARCLAANSNDLFQRGGKDVKASLPHAQRAIELCRQVRWQMLASQQPPPFEGLEAERMIVSRADYYQMINPAFYWNEVLRVYDEQDAATKARAVEFQGLLWETRFKLNLQFWYARATNQPGAAAFSDHFEFTFRSAERLAPSATAWVGQVEELMSQWLDVFSTNRVDGGGWTLASVRPLASLCCMANGGARRPIGMSPPSNWDHRRLGNWELQASDLERLGRLFDRMAKHPDAIVQCYGRVGQFALATRGQKDLNGAILEQFKSSQAFIRGQIASDTVRQIPRYQSLAYGAARDLIDMVSNEAVRRHEHQSLFDWMIDRRELVYWTSFMAVEPGATRFAQYSHWPIPFPTDSVGYTASDHEILLNNERRLRELLTSTNRHDVDASRFSFVRGTFERELDRMRSSIMALVPAPTTNTPASTPWARAETIFTMPSLLANGAIRAVLPDGDHAFLLVNYQTFQGGIGYSVAAVRVPLNGDTPYSIVGSLPVVKTTNMFARRSTPAHAVMSHESLFLNLANDGLWMLPVNGDPPHKLGMEAGLLSDHVGAFTVAGGKLYAMLTEGHLVVLDLESKQCRILASTRSKEARSPFDNLPTGFEVLAMLPDAPRNRVLFTTRFNEVNNCFPLIGLWQIDTRNDQLKQLLETYFPISWMALNPPDQLLMYCPRTAGEASTPCKPPFYSVAAIDLRTDIARTVWSFGRQPTGPNLPCDPRTIHQSVHAYPPFVIVDDWLWLNSGGLARLSLTTGATEDFTSPDPNAWQTILPLSNGKQILAAGSKSVSLLTLPEKESKDSPR